MRALLSSRRVVSLVGSLIAAACLVVVPSGAVQAAVAQGIAGTVTGVGGDRVNVGVWVVPVDPATKLGGGIGFTPCVVLCRVYEGDGDGHFEINLPVGEYWLHFAPFPGDDWASEWWQDSPTREGSETVVVTAGTLTTIDPELDHGGSITGTVDQAQVDREAIVEAWVADSTFPGGFARTQTALTDADGHYTLDSLPSASYRLRFVARTSRLEGWWQGGRTAQGATPVEVTAPATVAGIDPVLEPWGTVTGRVTRASDGAPVANVGVSVFWVDSFAWDRQPSFYATTASDGTYTLPAVAGTYRLWFSPPMDTYQNLRRAFWGGAETWQTAQDVIVGAAQTSPGIDVALEPTEVVNLTVPTISGVRRVGSVLTANAGAWYPSGGTFTYRWFRNGVPITGATSRTYRAQVADLGRPLSVRVIGTKAGYGPTTRYSETTSAIARGVLHLQSSPSISGTYRVGHRLRAVAATTSPSSTVAAYRWLRNGKPISGATGATYLLRRVDRGDRISVRMTLVRPGYTSVSLTAVRSGRVR